MLIGTLIGYCIDSLFYDYSLVEIIPAVVRTRTAKQWIQFNDNDHKDLFPTSSGSPHDPPHPESSTSPSTTSSEKKILRKTVERY